jgi:hypothetical protein
MQRVQVKLLGSLNKLHLEYKMPDTIKIIPLKLKNNSSVVKFQILMTPEECKDWSYIFCGNESLEYNGFEKKIKYDEKTMILELIYEYVEPRIILSSDLDD